MPTYPFLTRAESQGPWIIERGIAPEIEKAANERARKQGWI